MFKFIKNENRSSIEIIKLSVLMALTFIILTISLVTYGWFSNNKNVSATGMNIQVKTPDVTNVTIQAFQVTDIVTDAATSTTQYTFTESPTTMATLPPYDKPKILSSIYKKALVIDFIVETSADNTDINIVMESLYGWLGTKEEMVDPITKLYVNYISNIVQIKKGVSVSGNVLTADDSNIYSFISGETSNPTKANIEFNSINIPTAGTSHVYFVIEYNETLADYFYGLFVNINYSNDIHFLVTGGDAE